ncbi:MAG TPA: glycosyltransferase [Capillimicrobium sp.]|nr:glycosyltransferase [Capillimicrobium sp.]
MSDVRVTIVVPARDAAGFLPALLDGVARQDLGGLGAELLVVDNGSSDETAAVARAAGARVIREPTPGASAARNAGARAARGELVVFLDADCVPRDGWLASLVAVLDGRPDLGGAGGRIVAAPPSTLLERYAERRGDVTQDAGLADPAGPWVLTANCAYRRDVLERLGGFEPALRSGEDVDLSWRMQHELGLGLAYAPGAVVEHRHRTSLGGLWRQWKRYGWGTVQLAQRYPREGVELPQAASPARWAAARARALARALRLAAARRGDRLDLAEPFLDVFVRFAERVGRWEARRFAEPLAPVAEAVVPPPLVVGAVAGADGSSTVTGASGGAVAPAALEPPPDPPPAAPPPA